MALSLINYFVWDNDEARGAYMFADGIVLAALHYVNRGIKADQKTRETEAAKEVKQQHEMDKAESRAQHGATRENEKSNKHKGNEKKHFNVQQPKRD